MAQCVLTHALNVGDRVSNRSYGDGTLKNVDRFARGESIGWVLFDHPRLARYGLVKCPMSGLTRAEVEAGE